KDWPGWTRGRTPSSKCKTVEPLHNYVSGGALPSNRFGDRTSIDAHESQLTAEVDSVTNEEQARCRGMLLAAPHERNAVGIEDTEVADQFVQATAVAGRRDHRIGLYAGTVRQHDITLSKPTTAATISMRPALSSSTNPSSYAGAWCRRAIVVATPSGDRGSPCWSRRPNKIRCISHATSSATRNGRWFKASPGTLTVTPKNLRATRFGTVRHATRTRAAPPLASWFATSQPVTLGPTTRTSRPRYGLGLR